jgi:hypothetical protein
VKEENYDIRYYQIQMVSVEESLISVKDAAMWLNT